MTPRPETVPTAGRRRAVLIDFDWQDSDLVPALLRQPGLTVRLVAADRADSPGLRVAELCDLPRTVDLADLTREIFDVALVSERSTRRTQVEGLLLALGTPSLTPESFLAGQPVPVEDGPAIEASLALHAAAFEDAIGGDAFSAIVEQALPDLASNDAPTAPQPVQPVSPPRISVSSLSDFPSTEDRHRLEDALRMLMRGTGAKAAELYAGRSDGVKLVAQVGHEDPLLRGLVDLALELNKPQVMSRVSAPGEGRVWGAWPFRTTQHRGVLAGAAIDSPRECSPWEQMVEELRTRWDQQDRERTAPAFPMLPQAQAGWLENEEFAARIELAVERNRRDGLRFEVHRLVFPSVPEAVDRLCGAMPAQLRDTDCLARPAQTEVLLLTAGPMGAFIHLRRRVLALWERSWSESGQRPPAPPVTDHFIEVASPEDGEAFLLVTREWLSAS